MEESVTIPGYEDVEAGIVHWPLSVLRIRHRDEKRLIDLASHVLENWRGYTDADAFVFAETDGEPVSYTHLGWSWHIRSAVRTPGRFGQWEAQSTVFLTGTVISFL